MKAAVVVTNLCFRHVPHSFNRPANNTGEENKNIASQHCIFV